MTIKDSIPSKFLVENHVSSPRLVSLSEPNICGSVTGNLKIQFKLLYLGDYEVRGTLTKSSSNYLF